jgi:hypothetical protein
MDPVRDPRLLTFRPLEWAISATFHFLKDNGRHAEARDAIFQIWKDGDRDSWVATLSELRSLIAVDHSPKVLARFDR